MTGFTFTAEQIQSAPPDVRHWLIQEISRALTVAQRPAHDPAQGRRVALAACSVEQAVQILERIRGNFMLTQVFFEFARDGAPGRTAPGLHVLDLAEVLHHTRLASGDGLVRGLEAINAAYREVSGEAQASLFGFDDHGHIYLHEETHSSIRRLWEELSRVPAAAPEPPPPVGFAAPHLGPNEDIATHAMERPQAAYGAMDTAERPN